MNGLKTRGAQSWKDIVVTSHCLHSIIIELSGAGWAWDAGVSCGMRDPTDASTLAKTQMVLKGTAHSTESGTMPKARPFHSQSLNCTKTEILFSPFCPAPNRALAFSS
jgi:hypothetical protein